MCVAVWYQPRSGINKDLSVGILDADVNRDHDENGDGDAEITNQTTDLMKETTYENHKSHRCLAAF